MLKTEEMRAFPEQNHSFLHMTKPQSILQQNQTSNATNFLSPLLFDNSIKVIHPKKKTSIKAVQDWVAKSTRHSSIGWGPRLMKRRSLVRISSPPLVWICPKKKRVGCKAEYTARHPSCVRCTVSQKNADSGSSQIVYFLAPLSSSLPQKYSLLTPIQHGFNGFSNLVLPARNEDIAPSVED
jgi:hypothetical protein